MVLQSLGYGTYNLYLVSPMTSRPKVEDVGRMAGGLENEGLGFSGGSGLRV